MAKPKLDVMQVHFPDINKELEMLISISCHLCLQFSQAKSNSQIRWAVLNVVAILRDHKKTLQKLAVAMSEGQSIGNCIAVIEENSAAVLAR